MMRKIFPFLLFVVQSAYAQFEVWEVEHPLKSTTTLSGNFAELRRNHFHGGIDFRTDGVENKPVYTIDDGYVALINIAPGGYGKMALINHPNGYTTQYAHLNGFVPRLDSIIQARQYEKQSFSIEIVLQPDEYPVKKGEQFALSGNTGASRGPHLHFEIRKTDDNTLINPIEYFKFEDNRAPRISAVKIYGMENSGVVNNSRERKFIATATAKNRTLQGGADIRAWGEIGFAVKANDYMTGTGFSYGVRIVKLFVDDILISEVKIDNIKLRDSRAMNSFVDYGQYMKTKEFYMKSFSEPNSPLTIFKNTEHGGIYNINEERAYSVRYEVFDDFGLNDIVSFTVHGKKANIPKSKKTDVTLLTCKESHIFERNGFLIHFPENALYSDLELEYRTIASTKFCSPIHEIGNVNIPLHTVCDISIKVEKDTIEDKRKYFIAKLNPNNIITGSAGGFYVDGFMVGRTNVFEKFAIAADLDKPIITPVNTTDLRRRPYLHFKILDTRSGIARYDGYIDGEWILFEFDAKTNSIIYKMDKSRIAQNKNHDFKLVVTDMCGNVATFEKTIYW